MEEQQEPLQETPIRPVLLAVTSWEPSLPSQGAEVSVGAAGLSVTWGQPHRPGPCSGSQRHDHGPGNTYAPGWAAATRSATQTVSSFTRLYPALF